VARLNHPHIVQVYDYGSQGELSYIVMEFVSGRELKDYFGAKERFPLETSLRMMQELLGALEFAHEAGVVHRDVKPANVMLDAAGHVKLTDFGVARITDPDAEVGEATRAGAMIGTPSYMSPEQIQGQPTDRRSDVFSAGIVFYQLLTGKKPFEGDPWVAAKKIVQDDPALPSTLVQVPRDIDRVVARALAKSRDYRYPTARAFAEALARVAEGKPPEDPDTTVPLPEESPRRTARPSEAELEFWNEVKDSDDPDDVKLYIEQFPRGQFVELARRKVAELVAKRS
jgi:serine/threonine-protein kinase